MFHRLTMDSNEKMINPKITALDIIYYLKQIQFNGNFEMGVTEFCPYGESRRFDLFYFQRWNRETKGYEIKISRADFLADKKWQEYLKYCTFFYFIAPEGIIKKEELPENVGLIEIFASEYSPEDWSNDWYDKGQSQFFLEKRFTKKAKRLPDIEPDNYVKLLEGMLIKIGYEKNLMIKK